MSKVALITDIHIGARQASLNYAEFQITFFEKQFIPALKKNGISEIICLGDMFDTRQYSNHRILDLWKRRVFDVLKSKNITMHLIVGNHDSALKNTLTVNSPRLFLSDYNNIIIYDEIKEVTLGNSTFLFVPWICSDNYDSTFKKIAETKCTTIFGHFEFGGFEMHKGQIAHEGTDKELFKKFDRVYSGHYHHKSDDGHIFYLGNPYEMTWADYNDPRGWHIFDTDSLQLTFEKNKNTLFVKLNYNDEDAGDDYWKKFKVETLAGKYVKLVVENKTDIYCFDRLVGALYDVETADFKIVDEIYDIDADTDDEFEVVEDSVTLLENYVDTLNISEDKTKLKSLLKSLYVEALSKID